MSELTYNDYTNILKYYNNPIPKSKRVLKQQANKLIVENLCRCIKKFDKKNESRAIGICTRAVINNKGFTRKNKFTCKKPYTISLVKNHNKTKKHK